MIWDCGYFRHRSQFAAQNGRSRRTVSRTLSGSMIDSVSVDQRYVRVQWKMILPCSGFWRACSKPFEALTYCSVAAMSSICSIDTEILAVKSRVLNSLCLLARFKGITFHLGTATTLPQRTSVSAVSSSESRLT